MELRVDKRVVKFAPVIVLVVLSLVVSLIFGIQALAPGYGKNIATIETTTQQTGGATSINYIPVLANGVNWDKLSDGEREGTARYAVNTAIARAATEGEQSFNVLGLSAEDRQPVFIYSGGDTLTLYVQGETASIPLKA